MTYANFTVETDADGIALVTWDMPDRSMNVFTLEVMDEIEKIIDQVVVDAGIKGAVFTSGKDSFSGGADLTMLQHMLGRFHAEQAKDPDRAAASLRRRRPHGRLVAQAGDIRQALGVGDQRHLHGRCVRVLARLPRPCRGGLRQRQDGAARGEGRPVPGRRRHATRAAPDRPAAGTADDDLGPAAYVTEG